VHLANRATATGEAITASENRQIRRGVPGVSSLECRGRDV
jgi:hypothetical protein